MSGRVLITDHPFEDLEIERSLLEPRGLEIVEAPSADGDTLTRLAGDAAALLVCYARISDAVVAAAGDAGARVIARYGIGYDNVDLAAAAGAGITVTNVPDYCLDEVADHTIALLLAAARGIVDGAESVRRGGWGVPHGSIRRLRGRTLALVGVGQIGHRVALRAAALGLRVVGHDPFLRDWSSTPIERAASLDAALAEADVVSLHAPLTVETRHLIDTGTIAAMRRAPLIVNTARGPLVDLDAVVAALDDGTLSGVALDVTDPEPLAGDHPLRTHPRAIVTPHMAFYSQEAAEELRRRACDEVLRALDGRPPRCPVPLPAVDGA